MTIQANDSIFSAAFQTQLQTYPAILGAINASPKLLAMIAQARDTYVGLQIVVGESGSGWSFDASAKKIVVDPADFASYATNPGGFVLGLAHEFAHASDPNGVVGYSGFNDPVSYAAARVRAEGYAIVQERQVLKEWNGISGGNPYPNASLSVDVIGNSGSGSFYAQLNQLEVSLVALGRSTSEIEAGLITTATQKVAQSTPTGETTGATYSQVNQRDYFAYSLGVTGDAARAIDPTKLTIDVTSGFWSATLRIENADGSYRLITRTSTAELVRASYDAGGTELSRVVTPNGQLSVSTTTLPGGERQTQVQLPSGGAIASVTEEPDGSKIYRSFGSDGETLSTRRVQIFDDASARSETTYFNGVQEIAVVNASGFLTYYERADLQQGSTLIRRFTESGAIMSTETTLERIDSVGEPLTIVFTNGGPRCDISAIVHRHTETGERENGQFVRRRAAWGG